MREFVVNDFITLKLEANGKTKIYINDELFRQCKFLLLEIPIVEITALDEIESIDEVAESLDKSLEHGARRARTKIPPDVEFWGHCSNIQVWVENNYNTRLLHSSLAFPLLKRLIEVGDSKAESVFKEEIAKRLDTHVESVVSFLLHEGYCSYLPKDFVMETLKNTSIKVLDLREVRKDRLPSILEFIGNITTLQKLDLSYSYLETLPFFITKQTLLSELKLRQNNLSQLPEAFKGLVNLEDFDLRSNKFTEFPSSLLELRNLHNLDLGYNDISILPNDIDRLALLQNLLLGGNKLNDLPSSIVNLKRLRQLDLSNNSFEHVPDIIAGLGGLESLSLADNRLELEPRLVDILNNLSHLKALDLSCNEISEIPYLEEHPTFQFLDLSSNFIKEIRNLEQFPHLKNLNLSDNNISDIRGLDSLKELEILYLSANKYDKIQGLDGLVNLRYLVIDLDKVERLEGLHNLVKLEELNVGLFYPTLEPLLRQLGGVDEEGFIYNPQKVVDYCRNLKIG